MTTRKNQNSILVLATLGVYLGLVLVGATPQILAQAAMTRQFDVKDEIEVKDDLDKKPDGCDTTEVHSKLLDLKATYLWYNDRTIGEYNHLVELFIDGYSDVAAFDVNWNPADDARPSRTLTANIDSIGGSKSAHDLDGSILILGNGAPGKSFSFAVARDASGYTFRFESKAVPYDPPLVRYLYTTAFDLYRCTDGLELNETILRHTEVKVLGTNLVISTRLPRGSLDPLLAANAK